MLGHKGAANNEAAWFRYLMIVVLAVFYCCRFSDGGSICLFPTPVTEDLPGTNLTYQQIPKMEKYMRETNTWMYLFYHDAESYSVVEEFARGKHSWIHLVKLNKSKYFESAMYWDVFPQFFHEWNHSQFIITGTHRTVLGIGKKVTGNYTNDNGELEYTYEPLYKQTLGEIMCRWEVGQYAPQEHAVIPFIRSNSILPAAMIQSHTMAAIDAWYALLEAMGFDRKDIKTWSNIRPFYRNVFVIRRPALPGLMAFMQRARDICETNETVKALFEHDAHYVHYNTSAVEQIFHKAHYEMHPFIFERLPSFYFRAYSLQVCHAGQRRGLCRFNYD